jgi:transcriptional regulator with XRE-family HTH domain
LAVLELGKIGKQLASLRKEKGLTGEKLAEILNVSPQAIGKKAGNE